MHLFPAALLLLLVAAVMAGCSTPTPPVFSNPNGPDSSAAPPPTVDPRATNYANALLQEGDSLSITFQFATNFNSLQKVMLDGMINLDLVGSVKAAGRTPMDLQAEITKLYQRLPQVKDDSATVKLLAGAAAVYVSGAVNRPGKIPMEHPMTALEGIMEAGGFDLSRARVNAVTVVRLEGGRQRTYQLDLKRVLRGQEETPFYLKPYDVLHVPAKTFNF